MDNSNEIMIEEEDPNYKDINGFEDIISWQKARKLNKRIYDITKRNAFKKDESLKDQIRRASNSIMLNIAEGYARGSDKAFKNSLYIARGSNAEVKCALYIACDQQYIDEDELISLLSDSSEISRVITGFIKYLWNCINK